MTGKDEKLKQARTALEEYSQALGVLGQILGCEPTQVIPAAMKLRKDYEELREAVEKHNASVDAAARQPKGPGLLLPAKYAK